MPKFLLTKKYWIYFSTFVLSIAAAIALSGLTFNFFGFNPQNLIITNPLLAKISPIVKTNTTLMLFISIAASISLVLNDRLKQVEKEKLSAQISSLKSQINPHFLFNTLNNIYASAIDTSPQTADMVEKLSEMMRYTLKNTQNDIVPLEDEINYIQNYIELQKIRLDKNVIISLSTLGDFTELTIAPMLLICFIENAFKHGVNSEEESRIVINMTTDQSIFQLLVVNNKVNTQKDTSEHSGFGIKNTKHRLELIYPSKHILMIKETEQDFTASLHINLK
jgi:sensor histidine kinase YesM